MLEDQRKWILHAFELNINGIGAPRIAQDLNAHGYKRASGDKFTTSDVGQILRNRALLGEFEYTVGYDGEGKPIKEFIKAVYPTVISPEKFKEAEDARKETGMGQKNPNGVVMNNLFEKHCRCSRCGGIVGVRNGRNESKSFFCRNKAEGKGCDAPNLPYDEVNLLQRLADFRWEEFFGDEKHDAERAAAAAAEVERLAQAIATETGIVENLTKAVDDALLAGKGTNDIVIVRANKLLPEKEGGLRLLKTQHSIARRKFDNLKRRRNSAALSKDVRKRISAFIKSDRENVDQRREFNLWMRDTNLMFWIETESGQITLGKGWEKNGKTLFYGDNDAVAEARAQGGEKYEKEVDEFEAELDALIKEHGLYEGWRRAYGFPCPWEQM